MRPSAFLLLAGLLWATSLPAQNLLADKTKTKTKSGSPQATKLKLVTKQPATAKQPVAAKKAVAAVPVILFKRTPCFGKCPHYEATIYPDGRVTYTGFGDVRLTGTHELQLPPAIVNTILADARRLNFPTYEDRYSQGASDLPATVLSIRQPSGKLKTVQAEEGTPPELEALMKYISNEIDKISGGTPTADR